MGVAAGDHDLDSGPGDASHSSSKQQMALSEAPGPAHQAVGEASHLNKEVNLASRSAAGTKQSSPEVIG